MTRSPRPSRRAALAAGISALALSLAAPMAGAQEAVPLAPLPEAKEINAARADLGKMLFFDARLSGDTGHSCASCHDPEKGWGTGEPMSHAYGDLLYFRNAPGLFNVANRNFFMWDGRLDGSDLGTVVRDMLTESHTMNMDSRLAQERLKQVPQYMEMFEAAYGAEPYGGRIYGAIGEFLKTIRTENAPFDAYLRGQEDAISDAAKRGLALFEGKAGCASCHGGAMLSDGGLHAMGVPDHPELLGDAPGQAAGHAGHAAPAPDNATAVRQITLLRHYASMGTPNYMNLRADVGQYVVTKDEGDIGKFTTPSLWDVGQTAPYMHSGVFETLAEVVAFYNAGNDRIAPLGLSPEESADIVAFLESLTGDAPVITPPDLPDYDLRDVGKN
ncbi:cytochrome-c peroxidase [Roseovarius autotrophicus]|uniref:cytochrome-c peroxidase n=1 Tax=Roseovarius autotrophicus TaxID=2824121 RepID=UPI001B395FD4|nr:cytochrome c peroxidase [Roseovarius autotrophicus]